MTPDEYYRIVAAVKILEQLPFTVDVSTFPQSGPTVRVIEPHDITDFFTGCKQCEYTMDTKKFKEVRVMSDGIEFSSRCEVEQDA